MMHEGRDRLTGRRSIWPTLLVGIGLMAAVDEVVFHQVLGWHHFYDRSTPAVGLLSDGFLHAGELLLLIGGAFMLDEQRRRGEFDRRWAWSGLFIGLGGFQLFDGIVDHKVLRLHQIRYVENLLPYDLAWNALGVALLAVGMVLAVRARRHESGAR